MRKNNNKKKKIPGIVSYIISHWKIFISFVYWENMIQKVSNRIQLKKYKSLSAKGFIIFCFDYMKKKFLRKVSSFN